MTVYPFAIDGDAELIRIDDNLSQIGDAAINQLREAVFAIEEELGIRPSGTAGSVVNRLDAFSNPDGTIKASALASIALATLPISNAQVGTNAGIDEFKLNLDHATSDLYSLGISNQSLLNALTTFANTTSSDLSTHIGGGSFTADGSPARHVASHIDLNAVPSDLRDTPYTWTGLLDKDGNLRSASHVADALLEINDDFTSHQNATADAHLASSVSLNVDEFEEIPQTINDVQKLADHIDDFEVITVGEHRATQHANGIPKIARINGCGLSDGYSQIVVPSTPAVTYLVTNPNITTVDDISNGDDLVKFSPDNSGFIFDSQFSQVNPGDLIRINYGSGMEATYPIDSVRYVPGSSWVVRLNGVNLMDTVDGYASAMIYRPLYDRKTAGILAVAAANATPVGSFNNILSSVIVGNPRGAVAVGNGFDPGQLDATHYNLWLEIYPTGNPADRVIPLPAIDVTGDAGTKPGKYTLQDVVQNTNNALREVGYNYRLIAFEHEGDFGIMMADAINCASFSITSGSIFGGALAIGSYTNNVIGNAAGDDFDALGLGSSHAAVASPNYSSASSFTDTTSAQTPTKVIVPFKNRNYIVDGNKRDKFAPTWLGTEDSDGNYYWDGYVAARNQVGSFTVETTYAVNLDLKAAGLSPGKTLVVQPTVDFLDSLYSDVDYGRFIIKSVNFPPECPPECSEGAQTSITVISGVHGAGVGVTASAEPELPVKIYFSEDSVGFNFENIINQSPTSSDYHRLHEIFIDNQLKTFGHERARMLIQVQTGEKLASSDWHIENVSPKLRGYPDATLDQAKYLRLYILSYDTDTGEYDGYVGKRSGPSTSGITSVGPVTRGRKNVPTRFYDETYVDFIDLVFEEDNTTSGSASNILSDGISGGGGTPRYVDIELFPSLRLNDDMLLLATTEITWDPQADKPVVQRVIDRREFGSIDEEDFTQSAIDFISAGDRHLHENGVIRGYTFDSVNPSDNRELFFKGGVALVNGKVLTTNNLSVTIPQITENPATTGTVDWAICVNEEGVLEPIIVTTTKAQFFARDFESPNNTYYLPSVTFSELVDNRKDLTPIAVVTANISSIVISDSDVSDVRRNIFEMGRFDELVLSQEGVAGHFSNFTQVVNWVEHYYASNTSVSEITVQVRGTHTISSPVTLSFNIPVIFRGEGASIVVTSNQGLIIDNNVTFKNINFDYRHDASALSSTNYINTGAGCIYHGIGSNSNGLRVDGCKFTSNLTAQRYPFIGVELDSDELISNFVVENCTFEDPVGDGYRAAVAVVGLNQSVDTEPAYIVNSSIRNNQCLQRQGIYITSTDVSGVLDEPGVGASNVSIQNNSAGVIGYLINSQANSTLLNSSGYGRARGSQLLIDGNIAHFIGSFLSDGVLASKRVNSSSDVTYALGNVKLINNKANWMQIITGSDTGESSSLTVDNNVLSAYDTSYFALLLNPASAAASAGISVQSLPSNDVGSCIISNNYIDGYGLSSDSLYGSGIVCTGSCKILNNDINGFNNFGILCGSGSGLIRDYVVQNNNIKRENRTINSYIFAGNANDIITVTDNALDSTTVDGGSVITDVTAAGSPILASTPDRIIERNINQTNLLNVRPGGTLAVGIFGSPVISTGIATVTGSNIELGLGNNTSAITCLRDSTDNGSTLRFAWMIPLNGLLPNNTYLVSASAMFTPDVTPSTTSTGTVNLRTSSSSVNDNATSITTAGDTVTISPGNNSYKAESNFDSRIEITYDVNHTAAADIDINIDLTLTYRW